MAQHDYNIANQSGADFRADLNNALLAIATVNSGATEPSTTFAHQLWVDTSSSVLKIRNAADNAWITTGVSITASNTFTGDLTGNVTGNLTGNVTGNVTGDLTGNADSADILSTARTISLSGDVVGSVSFDGSANVDIDTVVQINSITLGTDTTGDYVESMSGGTGVTVTGGTGEGSTPSVAIGQAVATTDNVTFNTITATDQFIGDIRGAVRFNAKADGALSKGDVVYISGVSGDVATVGQAKADDASKMPAFGFAAEDANDNAAVEVVTFGTLAGLDTSNVSEGQVLYVSTTAGEYTTTKPTGESALLQNIGKVQRSHATEGSIKVGGAGRSNATPNLNDGNIFIGNASNQAVTTTLDTSIVVENTNLYYTTTRANTDFDTRLATKDTGDLTEGSNLYYTTARVNSDFDTRLATKSTTDLAEGTNLYYTSARFDSAFTSKDTDDLSEGSTNLYYTTARFDSAFGNKTTSDLTEGTNLYYTTTRANSAIDTRVTKAFVDALGIQASSVDANSVTLGTDTVGNYVATVTGTANKITVTGSGSESANITLTLPDDVQIADSLTVAGNLTVNGTLTSLDTTNLDIEDNLFQLNAGLTGSPVNDSGMLINRGTADNGIFMWDESVDKFTLGLTTADGTSTGNITLSSLGTLVANLEGNVTGAVTGTVSSLSNHDTGDLAEGSNLYYTDARVQAVSINNLVEDTTPQLGGNLASNGNDILFGDNDKAVFGAGSDLQIYHNGTASYIDDAGTGNLLIRAGNLQLQRADGTQNFLAANTGAEVVLYHAGSAKLATTSTGINVTGTVTADGLTVNSASENLVATFQSTDTEAQIALVDTTGTSTIRARNDFRFHVNGAATPALKISSNNDIAFYDDTGTSQNLKWDASADSLNFVDNAKANFGTGSDLSIYHSGTNSHIADTGEGNLYLDATNLIVRNGTGTKTYMTAANNGGVVLYHDNTSRFSTTSSGIDVTGTVTADLLTVSTSSPSGTVASLKGSSGFGFTFSSDATSPYVQSIGVGGGEEIAIKSGGTKLALFQDGGDISFYDDTGTSQALFWDASAESLGIGTTSPDAKLDIDAGEGSALKLKRSSTQYLDYTQNASSNNLDFYVGSNGKNVNLTVKGAFNGAMTFGTSDTERMRIDSSGNVGIGGTPTTKLYVEGASPTARLYSSTTTGGTLDFVDQSWQSQIQGSAGSLLFKTGGTAEAMRINSSGNVGIGTTSLAYKLNVAGDIVADGDGNTRTIGFDFYGALKYNLHMDGSSDADKMLIRRGTTNVATFDSTGNVLVGKTTSSFTTAGVELAQGGTAGKVQIQRSSTPLTLVNLTDDGSILNFYKGTSTVGSIGTRSTGLIVGNGDVGLHFDAQVDRIFPESPSGGAARDAAIDLGTSAARFKDLYLSDYVYCGKTTAAAFNTTVGTALDGVNGYISTARSGGPAAYFNRTTSDGDIVTILKDGSTVGSIGTEGGNLYIDGNAATGKTGIEFLGSAWYPRNDGSNSNGAVDLGDGSNRFKDLYLSGGAYLGGTGSANKLDDYEEGTFTPSLQRTTGGEISAVYSTSPTGTYTKIGRLVHITIIAGITSVTSQGSGYSYLTGLPFVYDGNSYEQYLQMTTNTFGSTVLTAFYPNSSAGYFGTGISATAFPPVQIDWTAGTLRIAGVYKTT